MTRVNVRRWVALCLTITAFLCTATWAPVRAQEALSRRQAVASIDLQDRGARQAWENDQYRRSSLSLEPSEPEESAPKWLLGWPTFLDRLIDLFNLADKEAEPGVGWTLIPGVQLAVGVESQETDGLLPVPSSYAVSSWLHFHLREW